MAKNDNKELHSILEQLKKSYSSVDGDVEENDASLDSQEDANDDFQKLLTNFFSTDFVEEKNQDTYNFSIMEEKVEYPDIVEEDVVNEEIVEDEEIIEDEVIVENEEIVEDEEIIEDEEIVEDEVIIENEEIVENKEAVEVEDIIQEVEAAKEPVVTENILAEPINNIGRDEVTAVENVFRIMFGGRSGSAQPKVSVRDEIASVEEASEYNDIYDIVDDTYTEEIIEATNDVTDTEYEEPQKPREVHWHERVEEYASNIYENTDDTPENIEDEYEEELIEEIPEYIQYSDSDNEDEIFGELEETDYTQDEGIQEYVSNVEDEQTVYYEDSEIEEEFSYSYDPLQGHLSDAAYVVHKSVDEKLSFETRQRDVELDDEDISLLLDFGYDDEIKIEAGAGRTNQIKRKKKSDKAPEKSERISGYSGEEYMDASQNDGIKSKYIHDKRKIVVRIAFVAVLALIMLCLSVVYWADVYKDRQMYPYIEALSLILTASVAASGLIEGARGIAKLDPKNYSIPVFLMIIQLIYDVFIIALQASGNASSDNRMITSGFIVIIYVLVALVADALECDAEKNTFDVVSSDGRLYSAEKINKPKTDNTDKHGHRNIATSDAMLGNCIYKVKETDIPHGYFARMSKKYGKCLRVMYFMGIVPVLALIVGCITLISNGNAYSALSAVITVIFMGFPMSFVLFKAVPYHYMSRTLSSQSCAIVGDISSDEYLAIDMLMFDDVDAIKVTESIEIRPEGNIDVASAIKTASRAFRALGGPLSRIVAADSTEENASINIVSIKDNGIEFYMDSYLHVVIGDKNFMAIHGMKVSSSSQIISSFTDNKATSVLYVAFNGVPQLGYIVTSKINEEFTNTIKALSGVGIKTAVSTYSPAINDYYFEANKPRGVASAVVYKPSMFEAKDKTHFVDGGVFAIGDPTKIATAFIEAKAYLRSEMQNKKFSTFMAILGIIIGIIGVSIIAIPSSSLAVGIISCVLILAFNVASVLGVVLKHLDIKKQNHNK